MLKKFLCLALAAIMMLGCFTACGSTPEPVETTQPAPTEPAGEAEVLKVLTLGHSLTVDSGHMINLVAATEGYEGKMVIGTLYYSGCKLNQHYEWWVGNKANYQFYVTDENGRRGTNNVSLEYCLAQGDWDFISLQQSNGPIRRETPAGHLENVALYTDTLINYFRQEFPKAEFLWHQTWANQIGYDRDGYQVTSFEQQTRDTATAREFPILLGEKYDCRRVPSGSAWQIIREGGYDTLCARLAINNGEGDYYHEGDIGGGQYLNACVWFETLTGLSCVGNSYRPVYTHNNKTYTLEEDFIATLQNAAHQTVEEMKAETN